MSEGDRERSGPGAEAAADAHTPTPLRMSDLPEFLRFSPAPGRARRDGWGEGVQVGFILHLARGAPAGEAARRVGRSRQSAYALAARAGGEGFRAAWDAAARFADEGRAAAASGGGLAAIETLLVPRFFRGRLLGFVQREDASRLFERIALLDRLAARVDTDGAPSGARDGARPAPLQAAPRARWSGPLLRR